MIDSVSVKNYKSIKSLEKLKLNNINILIGANGVGKSNFITFLRLLKNIADEHLQNYVAKQGGADSLLHFGQKVSEYIEGIIYFNSGNAYALKLEADSNSSLFFSYEVAAFRPIANWKQINANKSGYKESKLQAMILEQYSKAGYGGIPEYVLRNFKKFEIYHFHDTSANSTIKQISNIDDNRQLKNDGSNLASFLYYLKLNHLKSYKRIQSTINQIAPFFKEFVSEPLKLNPETIKLEWIHAQNNDYFNASHLSDGTLRFIALTTLLLQPNPPETIIIDEPELGLHPAAIVILAEMMKSISNSTQLIISTQSTTLINQFDYNDLIIVGSKDGCTNYKRLEKDEIESWLEDYSLGEAWEKNIIGGRP